MPQIKPTAADYIEALLMDRKRRASAEIVAELFGKASAGSIFVALTYGEKTGRFFREKIQGKYVYGLPVKS